MQTDDHRKPFAGVVAAGRLFPYFHNRTNG